jgi:hypothetical protein
VVALPRGHSHFLVVAERKGAVTRTPPHLIETVVFLAALLGVSAEGVRAAAEATPQRTTPGCPTGECIIGRTSTVPPELLCGPCPTEAPHPIPTFCPKRLAPGAYVYLNDKPYGHGFDSTPRVHGDPEFCYLIHQVWINDCHLESWPKRVQCEMELMGGCPIWQYTVDGVSIHGCFDDRSAAASCDHFGSVGAQDDPQTPTTGDTIWNLQGFEGRPLECGLQRNAYGPMAGFFTVAHGIGYVRACKPDKTGCGPWRPFDH